jgi:hypothetical protein
MPEKNEATWLRIAAKFATNKNVPNGLGAVDDKHIQIKKPDCTISEFMNYEDLFRLF